MKLDVTTLAAKKAGSVELSEDIFGLEPRVDILHRMVRYQLAKRQAGTHKTKTRSEISRTGAKWGKQKGGGTARHGSKRSNIFIGGGRAHGPQVRSHAHKLQRKVRILAMKYALSAKAGASELVILDDAVMKAPKTTELKKSLSKLGLNNVLVIGGKELDKNFSLAARNLPDVDVLPVAGINVYDVLRRHKLVLTVAALEDLEARFK
ncbi:LSU ribosomal protein L4p (L1e) [hydrothermal vent metagenome]|uniref:LSU ribosomal protein L4p (L1e) n=1 Tax=hydrothermal vent metagenome TaxID=652676 RepID=A0A3B0RFA4_9ZZZZ